MHAILILNHSRRVYNDVNITINQLLMVFTEIQNLFIIFERTMNLFRQIHNQFFNNIELTKIFDKLRSYLTINYLNVNSFFLENRNTLFQLK